MTFSSLYCILDKIIAGIACGPWTWRSMSETELIIAAQQGDIVARNQLYEMNFRLMRVLAWRIAAAPLSDSEDYLQETFFGFLDALKGYKGQKSWIAYLSQKVFDRCNRWKKINRKGFRIKDRSVHRPVQTLKDAVSRDITSGVTIDTPNGNRVEISREFAAFLDDIKNVKYREFFVLRFVEGLSLTKISHLWGVSPSAIAITEQKAFEYAVSWHEF